MVEEFSYKFNKYQTPINDELKKSLHREVYEDLIDSISSIKFIKNLIAPEEVRGYAKDQIKHSELSDNDDRKHYDDDRIVVNVTNPHILEGLDFFREKALYFEEHGTYTHLTPNANPKSEYALFWKEELRKWKHGMVRESDGEWIPGYLYFYWNYSPIWLVEKVGNNAKKGERKRKFPKPWLGDYLFYHYIDQAQNNGKHVKNLKSRGVGISFKCASMSPRNLYVYPGAGNVNFHLANEKGYLQGDKGLYGKVLECLDHIAENTPLPKLRLIDGKKEMVVQLGYQDEYGVRKGLLSSIHAISLKDNPEKARGARGVFCHYEEDGIFDNLEKAWSVNRPGFEDGGVAVGLMMALGTGGTEGASFEGSEKLFYNPLAYNIYGIPNVFDKNTDGSTLCGHFWGGYLNRNECYDLETGEPDVIKALIEIHKERFDVKYNSRDPNAITQKKAEIPLTPQEAVLRTEGTIFPVSDLKEHLENIAIRRDQFLSEHYVGELVRDNEGVVIFKPSANKYPIRSYDVDEANREGCLEIFEMPRKNANGEIPYGRYIAGIDPIDSDTGNSLFSVLIMDLFTDRIVAEYTGRPRLAEEAYEIALRTLEFYNAQANYESNLKGLFSYFDKFNKLHLLTDVPQIIKDIQNLKHTNLFGNSAKGTRANKEVNKWGRKLQADWMLQPVNSVEYSEEDSEEVEDNRLKLHTLRSLGYLEEAIKWNSDGNFDRISAGGMLFILREDRYKITEAAKSNTKDQGSDLANDNFFNRNYDFKRAMRNYEDED